MESYGPTITPTYSKRCGGDNGAKLRGSKASSGLPVLIPEREPCEPKAMGLGVEVARGQRIRRSAGGGVRS
jgi:hypothetical protein